MPHTVQRGKLFAKTYARDILREPVLQLDRMFRAIREGVFNPDSVDLFPFKDSVEELSDSSSDSERTATDDEDILDSVADTTKYLIGKNVSVDHRWFQHKDSGMLHRGKPGSLGKLACGRVVSTSYDQLASATELDGADESDHCDNCFVARNPKISKGLKRLASEPLCCEVLNIDG